MIQQTSLLAYREIQPTLGMKQREVLKVLRAATETHMDFSNTELAFLLRWPINTVTPRVNELRRQGLVMLACKRRCERTGRMVMAWKAKEKMKK